MISFSGNYYTQEDGMPTLHDICVALMRLPRWCGATRDFWPVGMHSHVVADLLKPFGPAMELAGLIHDFAEGCGLGDIASPIKSAGNKAYETVMLRRVCFELLQVPESVYYSIYSNELKKADNEAGAAERFLLIAGHVPGDHKRSVSEEGLLRAVCATKEVVTKWSPIEAGIYLKPNCHCVLDFQDRVEELVREVNCGDNATTVFAVSSPSPGVVRQSLAGSQEGRIPKLSACDPRGAVAFKQCNTPAGDYTGGVAVGTGFLMSCSVCGCVYSSDYRHQCHPDEYAEGAPC